MNRHSASAMHSCSEAVRSHFPVPSKTRHRPTSKFATRTCGRRKPARGRGWSVAPELSVASSRGGPRLCNCRPSARCLYPFANTCAVQNLHGLSGANHPMHLRSTYAYLITDTELRTREPILLTLTQASNVPTKNDASFLQLDNFRSR